MVNFEYKIARHLYGICHKDDKVDAEKVASRLVNELTNVGHLQMLPKIITYLENFKVEDLSFTTLEVQSPYPLSTTSIKAVKTAVDAPKDVVVKIKINESLVGGFVATYKGKIVDASIKNYLSKLRTKLLE